MSQDRLTSSIDDAYRRAALDPALWPAAMSHIADATRSDLGQLIGLGPTLETEFSWVSGGGLTILSAYARTDPDPAANFRIVASGEYSAEKLVFENHYDAVRSRLVDDSYVDFCRQWGISFGCQTILQSTGNGIIGLAVLRSQASGVTSYADRQAFLTHRRRIDDAVSLQVAIERNGHRIVAEMYEAIDIACFVLDRSFRVQAMSAPAETLLRAGTVTVRDHVFRHATRDINDRIAAGWRALVDTGRARYVPDLAAAAPLVFSLHRLPQNPGCMGFAPFAVLVAKPLGQFNADAAQHVREMFGLTEAEAAIAVLLAGGMGSPQICRLRNVTAETLKSQKKTIYSKLAVRREAELASLLARLFA